MTERQTTKPALSMDVLWVGVGVPVVIAILTVVLWLMGTFPDHNSRSLATVVIVGSGACGLIIVLAALSRRLEDYVNRKLQELGHD